MTRVGDDLVEAFGEMAAYLRGEVQAESYNVPDDILTAERIGNIRRSVATAQSLECATAPKCSKPGFRAARLRHTSRAGGGPMRRCGYCCG